MVTLRESILEERKSKKDFVGEATEEARIKEGRPIRSFTDDPAKILGPGPFIGEPEENIQARTEQGPSYWEGVPDVVLGELGKIDKPPEKPPAWLGQDIDRNEFRQSIIDKHFDGVDPNFIRPNKKATESFDPAFFPEEHAKAVQKIKAKRSENLATLTGVMDLFDKEMEVKEKFEKKESAAQARKEKKIAAAKESRVKLHRDLSAVNKSIADLNEKMLPPEETKIRMAQLVERTNVLKGLIEEADSVIGDTIETPVDASQRGQPVANADGTFSSERTIGIGPEPDGKYYNIPTLINGVQKTNSEAVELFRQGKTKAVGVFNTQEEADKAAGDRSEMLGGEYKTPEEIRDAFKAGTITRDQAKQYYLQITSK